MIPLGNSSFTLLRSQVMVDLDSYSGIHLVIQRPRARSQRAPSSQEGTEWPGERWIARSALSGQKYVDWVGATMKLSSGHEIPSSEEGQMVSKLQGRRQTSDDAKCWWMHRIASPSLLNAFILYPRHCQRHGWSGTSVAYREILCRRNHQRFF